MGPVLVVVVFVGPQDVMYVGFAGDQNVVEEFASNSADDSFAVGVHPRRPWRAPERAKVVGLENSVERVAVLGVVVAEQETQGPDAGAEVGGEVSGLLRCPCLCRVGGDAGDVQASGVGFEECQGVEACAEHGVEVEEVRGDDVLGLSGEEFPPGWPGAAWCWVDAYFVQDLPESSCTIQAVQWFCIPAYVERCGCRGMGLVWEHGCGSRLGAAGSAERC